MSTEELNKILQERGSEYGDMRSMAVTSQTLKKMLLRDDMTPVQKECLEVICTKLARITNGNPNNRDSWIDIGGYAKLVVLDIDRGG